MGNGKVATRTRRKRVIGFSGNRETAGDVGPRAVRKASVCPVIIFEGESLSRNEFPEDDSYAKYLSRNFLHTHAVTQEVGFCLGKVVEGTEIREKWNLRVH